MQIPQQTQSFEQQVRGVARTFVAQAFYMPLLKELREDPLQSEMGKTLSGGRGGEAFGALLDQHRAQHLAGSADGPLVNAITKRMLKAADPAAKPTAATTHAIRSI